MAARQLKRIVAPDGCLNLIRAFGKGNLEARMVVRKPGYISTYLSSHSGCKMGCKFCWLTQLQQTDFKHAKVSHYVQQLDDLLEHSELPEEERESTRVNINFMARGEPLANSTMVNKYEDLYLSLDEVATDHGFESIKMNVSTIMPPTMRERELFGVFGYTPVTLFYSLYSLNPVFRKKWMPNAIDPLVALDKLERFQQQTGNTVVFHWTFIEGENDDEESVEELVAEIRSRDFTNTKFNLVRFNPPDKLADTYREPEEERMNELFEIVSDGMTDEVPHQTSRIVPRVGKEAFVSCGMFVED